MTPRRTAVVHDWLNGMRGGEKVLEAILPLVPNPTIFTLFHVPGSVSPAIERQPIRTSYLNRLPFSRRHYRNFLPLFASAVESFDLSGFDLVVSSSHCVAKGAIAPPGVPHLCYCHTPVRYAYEQFDLYFPPGRTRLRALKAAAVARLRAWDIATAPRPTRYLANSSAVSRWNPRTTNTSCSGCCCSRPCAASNTLMISSVVIKSATAAIGTSIRDAPGASTRNGWVVGSIFGHTSATR